ncbi:hypothetical protein DdX_09852 [Ditylenchus destructor]|uniref:Uncharacterized protein n=1 Tax=Ditylenchus destructor TaxID=166010 RepID=A0AAD4N5A2_9BILA|nr:hypothetical protein DdX_09852 [Ditylenchus destructor]
MDFDLVETTSVPKRPKIPAKFRSKTRESNSLCAKNKNMTVPAKYAHYNLTFFHTISWLLLITLCCANAFPSNEQGSEFVEPEQPVEIVFVQRRSSGGTSSSDSSGDQLEKMIFTGRIAAEEGDEDDTEKEHLVFEAEDGEDEEAPSLLVNIGTEDDGRRPVLVVEEPRKEKTKNTISQRQNRKRYLVSRSALRQKLLDRNKAEAEKASSAEDPFMLVDSSFSSPFDSRPSLNSLAASNKAVAAATRALISQYHANLKKDDPVRLCGLKLTTRTREICQHCPPQHLRPLFLIDKRGSVTHRTAGTRNVEKLTELCCVRKCTDETIRRLCCKEDHI